MKLAVIHTGDRDAVLRQAPSTREWEAYAENATDITAALRTLGHDATRLTDGRSLAQELARLQPDLAWVCSGGIQGRDPATHLPALLEMLGVPYVGSPPLPAGLADNKAQAKALLRDAGIATPRFTVVAYGSVPDPDVTGQYPVIVKPVAGMCSCGVMRVDTPSELRAAVAALQARYRDAVLVEQFVDGVDVTVGVLQQYPAGERRCLPVLQRFFAGRDDPAFARWPLPHPESQLREGPAQPADLSEELRAATCAMALSAFSALGVRHYARFDFRLSGSSVWFLEANHRPDLTRRSLLAQAAGQAGLEYNDLIGHILNTAMAQPPGRCAALDRHGY